MGAQTRALSEPSPKRLKERVRFGLLNGPKRGGSPRKRETCRYNTFGLLEGKGGEKKMNTRFLQEKFAEPKRITLSWSGRVHQEKKSHRKGRKRKMELNGKPRKNERRSSERKKKSNPVV